MARMPTQDEMDSFIHLLGVQFWLMGRDAEHPDGNLLCRLGFERERTRRRLVRPVPSRYRRPESAGDVIVWRCGVLLGASGTRLLVVRGLRPVALEQHHRPEDIHDPDQLFALHAQCPTSDATGLRRAALWFASYEEAVSSAVGVTHRVPPRGSTPSLAPGEPCSLEHRWRSQADRLLPAVEAETP